MTTTLYVVFILSFLLFLGYLLIPHVYLQRPTLFEPVNQLVQHGLIEPIQSLSLPSIQSLSDWIPFPKRRYTPNPYGYGGLDPSGGTRKGGDGSGIPDAVSVGWWNGEIPYSDRSLSPVQDTESIPEPKVAQVGWWGDHFLL
jgi:hypothetical protein